MFRGRRSRTIYKLLPIDSSKKKETGTISASQATIRPRSPTFRQAVRPALPRYEATSERRGRASQEGNFTCKRDLSTRSTNNAALTPPRHGAQRRLSTWRNAKFLSYRSGEATEGRVEKCSLRREFGHVQGKMIHDRALYPRRTVMDSKKKSRCSIVSVVHGLVRHSS
jgi:hypothetical protein